MEKRGRKLRKDCRGTTLVNVIVAFAMLMIVGLLFAQAVRLASNMATRAGRVRDKTSAALAAYYDRNGNPGANRDVTFSGADGRFTVKMKSRAEEYDGLPIYSFGKRDK